MASGHPSLGDSMEVGDIRAFVELVFAGRVVVLDGFVEIAPGIEAYLVGGHTPGLLQIGNLQAFSRSAASSR
jgi:glyoxylase-like metal-dependent hydrolase (beta-lactamase superfamily II)